MIRKFPLFSKLSIEHRSEIVAFTSNFEPYSDFNFTSLFCWNIDSSAEVSLLNGNLVIKIPDYLSGEPVYSILGKSELNESIVTLLNVTPTVKFVPHVVIEKLQESNYFTFTEDRDNFDYVYGLNSLAHLPGGGLKKKRNKVYGFQKAFDNQSITVTFKTLLPEHADDLLQVFVEWSKAPSKHDEEIQAEYRALKKLIDHSDRFNIRLTEVRIRNQLMAFSLNEILDTKYALCHFEKALPAHQDKNIYTFLTHQSAQSLIEQGCKYVNWEQDLGIAGLRKSKMSYKPASFLKKYYVKSVLNDLNNGFG